MSAIGSQAGAQATPPGEGVVWISSRSLVSLKRPASQLPLRAIKVLSKTVGAHLSRFRGRGMEFDEARLYQPGDDVRNLDWRVMARTGQAHTKIFREERERSVILWVDYRAPMFFSTKRAYKSVLASRAAALLAWSARKHGERLGGLAFSEDGHQEIRPQTGDRAVLSMLGLLSKYSQSPAQDASDQRREESLINAIIRLRRVTKPGSLVFLISDFRNRSELADRHLAALAQHNDVVLLYLYDSLEQRLPKRGWYQVTDGQRKVDLDMASQSLHDHHQRYFDTHVDALETLSRKYRMHLLSCKTDEDLLAALQHGLGGAPR